MLTVTPPSLPACPEPGHGVGRWMRWWTVARLLRYGINVAQWDVDLTIHGDMYKFFKSEAMEGIHWVCGCEGSCSGMECNGGAPAHPDTRPKAVLLGA